MPDLAVNSFFNASISPAFAREGKKNEGQLLAQK
jgi:hypothetical protein